MLLRSGPGMSWAGRPVACRWPSTPWRMRFKRGGSSPPFAPPLWGRYVGTTGLDHGATAVGIGRFVEGIDGRQNDSARGVDQVNSAQVPAGVAYGDGAEVTVPCGNLKAHPIQRDRAIALALAPLGFQAKGVAERFAGRALTEHVGPLLEGAQPESSRSRGARRRLYSISAHAWVALFKKSSVSSATPSSILKSRPSSVPENRFLLAVWIGAVRERALRDDAQAQEDPR